MSRSIHQTRKSARKAFAQGDLEPLFAFTDKLDLKREKKKLNKEVQLTSKLLGGKPKREVKDSVILSALKRIKKAKRRKLDLKFGAK